MSHCAWLRRRLAEGALIPIALIACGCGDEPPKRATASASDPAPARDERPTLEDLLCDFSRSTARTIRLVGNDVVGGVKCTRVDRAEMGGSEQTIDAALAKVGLSASKNMDPHWSVSGTPTVDVSCYRGSEQPYVIVGGEVRTPDDDGNHPQLLAAPERVAAAIQSIRVLSDVEVELGPDAVALLRESNPAELTFFGVSARDDGGLRIFRMLSTSLPAALGFRDGDVILSIDGAPTHSLRNGVAAFLAARSKNEVKIGFRRRGEIYERTYRAVR